MATAATDLQDPLNGVQGGGQERDTHTLDGKSWDKARLKLG